MKTTNKAVITLIDKLNELSLVPNITKPTRVTKSTATLIDQIYASCSLCYKISSRILISDMSDHFPCLTTFGVRIEKQNNVTFHGHELSDKNIDKLCNYMSCYNWSNLEMFDADTATDLLYDVINTGLDIHMPLKEINCDKNKIIREPWLTKGILLSVRKSKKQYFKYLDGKILKSA